MRRKFILLASQYPGLKLLLLRRTLPELRENHIIPLLSELPSSFAKYNDTDKTFTFVNGSRLVLGYCDAEKDVFRYQGHEYDVIGLEEATHFSEEQYTFLTTCNRSTRTDFKPRMYYTANPGGPGHAWFKRLFIDRDYRGKEKPENYVFIQAKVYDNKVLMETNPEYVETLENLPEELRRAHLEGDWDVMAGQFFKEWNREIHVIKPFDIPRNWLKFRSLDYGLDMTACYWWAVDTRGYCYIYRELHEPNLILSESAKKILDITPENEIIQYTVASPDLWQRKHETGESGAEIMSKAGLTGLRRAKNGRIAGWRVMREYLKVTKDEFGQPTARLRFFENCKHAIKNIPLLQHDENVFEDAASNPHEVTHAPESIRYGCMSRPPITPDGQLEFPEDMPEIEKSRAILNMEFEVQYRKLLKHKANIQYGRW
jgi:phage terminase large subunit